MGVTVELKALRVVPFPTRMESGDRIGPYLIRGKLAAGGMAEIYRAVREGAMGVGREVCIKRIRRELGGVELREVSAPTRMDPPLLARSDPPHEAQLPFGFEIVSA